MDEIPSARLTRRECLGNFGRIALVSPLAGTALLNFACGSGSGRVTQPQPISDDQFLDDLERACCLFFWEQASPTTGLVKDRAAASGNDASTVSSIASTGFGLTALCIADQRGYVDSASIRTRVLATLTFLANQANVNGFFYHWVDMNTGQRAWNSEVSCIDTTILLCGILTCRQHFQDQQIQSLATGLYQQVDWPWMLNGGTTFAGAWTPENGFTAWRWDTYSELMMMYLLAIGSTTFPIPATAWGQIARPTLTYQGLTYITNYRAPLFIHQFSHAWFDFRNQQDAYANYFNNSVTATQAHKLFCLSLASQFSDYQNDLWGITASDTQSNGYQAWGGPPAMGPIDGSVVPSACAGSLPFLPAPCIAVLRNIRNQFPQAWEHYGFVGAFNPRTGWYDLDAVGIQTGIAMLMAENHRSGFVWNTFMRNPEARGAMTIVGFH